MRKIQLGSGSNVLEGWENYDMNMDITKPLRFENESVDILFCEHTIEHIEFEQFKKFLDECFRILKPNGTLRLAFPSLDKFIALNDSPNQEYFDLLVKRGYSKIANFCGTFNSVFYHHLHKFIYDDYTIVTLLQLAGFGEIHRWGVGESLNPNLKNVEKHGIKLTEDFNKLETSCIEAIK